MYDLSLNDLGLNKINPGDILYDLKCGAGRARTAATPYYNPKHPPESSVVEAMNSDRIKSMVKVEGTDCSEIAEQLLKSAKGKGKIIEVRPKETGKLTVRENGRNEPYQAYHQVYTDGKYIYDPRLSPNPIPIGDWKRHISKINGGRSNITISDKLLGLQY